MQKMKSIKTAQKQAQLSRTIRLCPSVVFFAVTLILLTGAQAHSNPGSYYVSKIRYWTRKSPSVTSKSFYHRHSFDSSVIRYKPIIEFWKSTRKSKRGHPLPEVTGFNLKITNTRRSLLDTLQVLNVACYTSQTLTRIRDNRYIYQCYGGSLSTFSSKNLDKWSRDLYPMYLELPMGVKFTGYDSLSHGFILKSSRTSQYPDFVFDYSTPSSTEMNQNFNTFDYDYFPYDLVLYTFFFQFLILVFFTLVYDKRRIPLYSLFIFALGYIPMFAIIKRGTFAKSDSGYNSLYIFYLNSLVVALIGLFGRKSRKKEKLWCGGVLTTFAAAVLYFTALFVDNKKFQMILLLGPLALIAEKNSRSKHKHLSFITLALHVSQSVLYHLLLNSWGAKVSAMYNYDPVENYFPIKMYAVLVLAAMIVCFSGEHVKASKDWKEDKEEKKEVVRQLPEGHIDPFAGDAYVTAPSLASPFAAPKPVYVNQGLHSATNQAFVVPQQPRVQQQPQLVVPVHQRPQVVLQPQNRVYLATRQGQHQGVVMAQPQVGFQAPLGKATPGAVYEPF